MSPKKVDTKVILTKLLSVYLFCYGPLPAAPKQTFTQTRKHVMRFKRTNELGRRSYSIPAQPRYSGGRPYRSFSRPPIKYSSVRSQPRDFGQTRRTPYGRVKTLRYDLDRIPGDRNFIRIRQIVARPRVVATIPVRRGVKRPGLKISQFLSPLQWGGGNHPEDYVTPDDRPEKFYRIPPKSGTGWVQGRNAQSGAAWESNQAGFDRGGKRRSNRLSEHFF